VSSSFPPTASFRNPSARRATPAEIAAKTPQISHSNLASRTSQNQSPQKATPPLFFFSTPKPEALFCTGAGRRWAAARSGRHAPAATHAHMFLDYGPAPAMILYRWSTRSPTIHSPSRLNSAVTVTEPYAGIYKLLLLAEDLFLTGSPIHMRVSMVEITRVSTLGSQNSAPSETQFGTRV
jgi:hypothetical protein